MRKPAKKPTTVAGAMAKVMASVFTKDSEPVPEEVASTLADLVLEAKEEVQDSIAEIEEPIIADKKGKTRDSEPEEILETKDSDSTLNSDIAKMCDVLI